MLGISIDRAILAGVATWASSTSAMDDRAPGAAAPDGPSIAGKWVGEAGPEEDRVAIGFEFVAKEGGGFAVFLHQSVINFYGLELPGTMREEDGRFVLEDFGLTLEPRDGRLEGTYLLPEYPVSLRRSEQLPVERPIPDLPPGPPPRFVTRLGGQIYAPAALSGGRAYVGTTTGSFHAVALADGRLVWSFFAGRPIFGEALVDGDRIYFVCDNGYLFALECESGREVWRYDLGDARAPRSLGHPIVEAKDGRPGIGEYDFDHQSPKPVKDGAVLYVGAGDGGLHAVDRESGERIWRYEGPGKIRATAAFDEERVYAGCFGGAIVAVDKTNGVEVWRRESYADVTTSPAWIAGRLIAGNRGGWLGALDPETGATLWRRMFWGSSVESSPVAGAGSTFYIGASDLRRVTAFDAVDGRVIWRTDVFGVPWPRPAISATRVYVATLGVEPYQMRHRGGLCALDRESGELLWRRGVETGTSLYSGFCASPAIADGILVVGGLDGSLHAFDVE